MGSCQEQVRMRVERLLKEEGRKNEQELMFKRKFRLPKGIKFNNSRLISTPLFTLKIKENGLLFNRFGTVVSKKIDKRAVVRNRMKRLISSCARELNKELIQGYDILFIVKSGAVGKNRQEFYRTIKQGLEKAGFAK